MTDTPARIGPSWTKDASRSLLTLLLLGLALPIASFYVVVLLGSGLGPGHGDDGDGLIWVFLGVAFLAGLIVPLAVGIVVAVRGFRAEYRLLPFVAVLSPFVLVVAGSSGMFR